VQEKQPIAPRSLGPPRQLRAAAARPGDALRARLLRQLCRAVSRPAIGDNDLSEKIRVDEQCERFG
jgi:hypothetical protein